MGRKPKYDNGRKLSAGIERYFNSISYFEKTDQLNANGAYYMRRVWLEPPCLDGIWLALGVAQTEWNGYKDHKLYPELSHVCELAESVIRNYLYALSLGKDGKGAIYNLQANYGFTERTEMEDDGESRKAIAESVMSLSEKIAAITAAAEKVCAAEQSNG